MEETLENKLTWENFYLGSRRFQFLGEYIGLSIDQVNFLISQVIALLLGYIFRVYLHPDKVSATTRYWTALSAGLFISYFCFGKQILLALFLVVMCYCILHLVPPAIFHHTTLFASITFLSVIHIQRQIYEDGAMVLDITGPLMIMVQKVTSLAYSLHDGLVKKEKLTQLQKSFLIREKPNILEYFSYLLCFQSILAGPYFMFTDYQDFIEGTLYVRYASMKPSTTKEVRLLSLDDNFNSSPTNTKPSMKNGALKLARSEEPDPTYTVLWKVLASVVCAFLTLRVAPLFPTKKLADSSFLASSSFFHKLFYILITTTLVRQMYYTGWFLSDAVCNMSGLGFNGYDQNGKACWNLVSNFDFWGVEFGNSFKLTLEGWNIGTMKWLRFLVYERAVKQKTLLTYLLSSLWHGFYPGYYLTFLSGALFTITARTTRRCVRHRILELGTSAKRLYDLATLIITRFFLSYSTFPFVLLRFWPSLQIYRSIYFYLHLVGFACILVLPKFLPPLKRSQQDAPIQNSSNGVTTPQSKESKSL